jgi:AcrR family transcriptional regulator
MARRMQPAERAATIADAAQRLAAREGLGAVTLRRVAAEAGITPALVAHYEPNMERLVARTFSVAAFGELDEVRTAIDAAPPVATERVRLLLDSIAVPERHAVAELWADAWSLGRRNAALADAARRCMDGWQSLASGLISEGIAAGDFRAAEPEMVGMLLLSMVDAMSAYELVQYRTRAEFERMIREVLATQLGLEPGTFLG